MFKFLILILLGLVLSSEHWDGVLAVVNNKAILRSDVLEQTMMLARQKQIDPQKTPLAFERLFYKTLDNQIDRFVVLSAAEQDTLVDVSSSEVTQNLNQRIDAFVESFESEKAFEDTMQTTVREMKIDYRQNVRDELFVEKFRYSFFNNITIGRPEVIAFYNDNPDSFPSPPDKGSFSIIQQPVETSKTTIDSLFLFASSLKKNIEENKISFSDAAKNYSDYPSAKEDGGDFGEITRNSFLPKYEKVAFGLSEGDISEPFQTSLGIHLVQLISKVGEKFHSKQILFNLNPRKNDIEKLKNNLLKIKKELFYDPGAFDSTAVDYYNNYKNYSGVYVSIEYNKLPILLEQKLKQLKEHSYSDIFTIDSDLYLIYKYTGTKDEKINLNKDWIIIEKRALENKKTILFQEWLKTKKESMYIKINSF